MLNAKEIEAVKREAKCTAGLTNPPVRVSSVMQRAAKFMGVVAQNSLIDVRTELEKPVVKETPRKCHGQCRNFEKAQFDTGSCGLDKNPVAPDKVGCKNWESTGDDRLFAEVVNKRAKYLAGV